MFRNRWFLLFLMACMLLIPGGGLIYYKHNHGPISAVKGQPQELQSVKSIDKPKDQYDVIVVGTDPEGITAAVSASRNGLKTLLVEPRTERNVLGGLMTEGWLATIDMNWDNLTSHPLGSKPFILNKGIFSEWYQKIEGDSFDVTTGSNVFYNLVRNEKNIDLLMKAGSVAPIVQQSAENRTVEGISIAKPDGKKQDIRAKAVIDATQDGDIAAAADVPFTIGHEDIGDNKSKMAVTLVFRLKNVDDKVWAKIQERLKADGNPNTDANEVSAWGFSEMQKYPPVNKERTKMRGLNVGRQNGDTVIINALQIFGVDGLDPKSREEGKKIGLAELPHVVDYIKKTYPELANVELDGTAPELYVRETRHMVGMYRLSIVDIVDNKDQWDRIAFGSYTVDIQRTSPSDNGVEVVTPEQYAIPFRSIVPKNTDGLLVVGRAASYDALAFGSARVIPNGMAEGEAAGAAVRLAIDSKMSFRQMAVSKEQIAKLQDTLNRQGMDLKPFTVSPTAYMKHKAYPGLRAAVYLNLTSKGTDGKFDLDAKSNPKRVANALSIVKKRYPAQIKGNPAGALAAADTDKTPLTLDKASCIIAKAAGLNPAEDKAVAELLAKRLLSQATVDLIADKQNLTNGESYLMYKDLAETLIGLRF